MNRRRVLKVLCVTSSSLTPIGALLSAASASMFPALTRRPGADGHFTDAERAFVDAATARIIPTDDTGAGAREAGVTQFIESQLAGDFGDAARWYMQGPFKDGTDEQGYQLPLTPAQLYSAAIRAVDQHCRDFFGGRVFADLDAEEQDEVLRGLEAGEPELGDVDSRSFFQMLRANTVEGFLSDPMYGGNQGFVGWRLIGFPGPRYDYTRFIGRHGEPFPLPPVGILGRDGFI
jgi:gluconate 2-dehydrogenase gamma chain